MPFLHALILGGVPSVIMLTSTYIGLGKEVPEDIAGALQHFAAGVLLCTVGTELLPELVHAQGWLENIAAFVGFFCGVAVLILLGMFSPEEIIATKNSNDMDDVIKENISRHTHNMEVIENGKDLTTKSEHSVSSSSSNDEHGFGHFDGHSPTPMQKQQMREMRSSRFVIMGRRFRQRQTIRNTAGRLVLKRSMSLSSLPMVSERDPLLLTPPPLSKNSGSIDTDENSNSNSNSNNNNHGTFEENPTEIVEPQQRSRSLSLPTTTPLPSAPPMVVAKQFPLAFVLAVAIDSSLDGLLIGIASVAGPSAGPMMSASLSVEMGFLGLTLATALYGQSIPKAALAGFVGPACLVLAAVLGGVMADTLSHSPVASIGMLSFGASALLFMVAEELLLDAHETGAHVWWVDLQLYTGFFASMMAGKFARQ